MTQTSLPTRQPSRKREDGAEETPGVRAGAMGLKEGVESAFEEGSPLAMKDLYSAFPGWKRASVRKTVYAMLKEGVIEKVGRGLYVSATAPSVTPPAEKEGPALYCGDSLNLLPLLEKEGFRADLLCSDPPYNIYGTASSPIRRGKTGKYRGRDIDNRFEFDNHKVEPEDWIPPAVRCLKEDAVFACFLGARQMERAAVLLEERGFKVNHFTVYVKTNPTPQARKVKWCSGVEHVLIGSRGDYHYNWRQGHHPGYMLYPVCQSKERVGGHPTQKPLEAVEDLVKWWSFENDTVLDPFMGVGTTGVAARKNRREFVGIELERKWYEVSAKRISRTVPVEREAAQARLFSEL